MGMENDAMLDFLRDNRRFADMFNGGVFAGECVVEPADLEEGSESYTEYKREERADGRGKNSRKGKASSVTRTRDVKKRLKSGAELRILAIEEQSLVDYTMPWRCMNYDVLEYGRQVKNRQRQNEKIGNYTDESERLCRFRKTDLLAPVYTVCLYHGEKKWDGPRTLQDMMDFGEDRERTFWEREFANYGMRLVCVNELEDVSKFTTELREVFEIMNHRGDRQEMNQFLEQHEEYKRLDEETAWVIGTVMGVDVFMENHERYKTKGGYNMCTAIREMWNDGKNEGVNLSAAVFRAVKNGLLDDQEIAALCECTVDEVRKIRTVFGI